MAKMGTLLLVADCIEKLTVLSKVNQVTIMWVPGHGRIQQNETADKLAREGAMTRPIGPEPFLPLFLSRFKYKIRNWIEKIKNRQKGIHRSPRAHMSISHRSGDRGLERYASLKYFNVEKQKSRFTLGLDAAKNTNHIKKRFK